jgi:hypothetical protein
MPDPSLPALFVVSGLVGAVAPHTPRPTHDVTQAQLRALNHRFMHAGVDPSGKLIAALTHADFLCTRCDGSWVTRSDFMAQVQQRGAAHGARAHDESVRLFGPVALVHGVFHSAAQSCRYTDVYVWGDTGWQLVSTQDTALKQGVAPTLVLGPARADPAWTGQDPTGDELHVLTTLNALYVASFREADVAWYGAHLAADYVVIGGNGAYKDRAAALADFALPTFAANYKSFPVAQVQVRQFGELALIHAANCFEMKDGRTGESRYTDIWHRVGQRWRCVAAHITPHKVPAQPPG